MEIITFMFCMTVVLVVFTLGFVYHPKEAGIIVWLATALTVGIEINAVTGYMIFFAGLSAITHQIMRIHNNFIIEQLQALLKHIKEHRLIYIISVSIWFIMLIYKIVESKI